MHYFIYPTKDTWISSGSKRDTTGVDEKDQNHGQDQILEIKKVFYNYKFDHPTRALVHFDLSEVSKSIHDGYITNPKFYLRLYEADGTTDLSSEYSLAAYPLSESWDEGTGKFGDNPKVTDGASWNYRINKPGASTPVSWSYTDGNPFYGGSYISSSGYQASQSFSYQSPDINMDVTNIVNGWLDNTNKNYGFLLAFSGSQETETGSLYTGDFKFFSSNTHTIYPPKLEIKWDDHKPVTGSNTGSMIPLSMSNAHNYVYVKQLRDKYKETEKVRFYVGARKRYIQKSFSTSVTMVSASYIPEGSGSYSITDVATGESVIPFSAYTSMSCSPTEGMYFDQWLNTFQPNRVYKILLKVKYDGNREIIYDDDFEFKVTK
tara:strand:+ start:57 stop:1184 length:1128 start_codon:yes stop_codon:yes gene_type:complete